MADPQKEKQQPQKPAPAEQRSTIPLEVTKEIDELMRRLKLLEERYSGLRKKSQFSEQNMLKETKELLEEAGILRGSISEIKAEISEINEKLLKLAEEVEASVKKTDFKVVAKYLDFWQPMNFLTREEAERLIAEAKERKE